MSRKRAGVMTGMLAGALIGAAGMVLGGCSGFELNQNAQGDGLLDMLFSPPSAEEYLADAQDPYDADRRYRGTLKLASMSFGGEPVYVSLYAKNAEDDDASVRAAACKALGRHGGTEHGALLAKLLRDPDSGVRLEAAKGLQRIHTPDSVEALLMATREPESVASGVTEEEPEVRAEASLALAQYRERKVIQALIAALGDSRLAVNRNALISLRTLTGQDLGYDRGVWLEWLKDTKDPFAAAGIFQYPAYSREKWYIEYLPLVPKPPNESSSTPAGMPLGPPPQGS